ncbi:hypothetical protein ERO13_A03G074650v2 [Gossypium hirsutum]|nr:hypothetical protein ERO13_A03G074650v2 [Gossypium hirsutum]
MASACGVSIPFYPKTKPERASKKILWPSELGLGGHHRSSSSPVVHSLYAPTRRHQDNCIQWLGFEKKTIFSLQIFRSRCGCESCLVTTGRPLLRRSRHRWRRKGQW